MTENTEISETEFDELAPDEVPFNALSEKEQASMIAAFRLGDRRRITITELSEKFGVSRATIYRRMQLSEYKSRMVSLVEELISDMVAKAYSDIAAEIYSEIPTHDAAGDPLPARDIAKMKKDRLAVEMKFIELHREDVLKVKFAPDDTQLLIYKILGYAPDGITPLPHPGYEADRFTLKRTKE